MAADPFTDLYPPTRPPLPSGPADRGTPAAQRLDGANTQPEQIGINPRAPQASAKAAQQQANPFADLMPSPAPSAQSAGEPPPYKNKVEALDDAVNYLDEGRDIAEVSAGFQGIGITQDEIIRHAQQRGAASTQPTLMPLANPETAPNMAPTAGSRTLGTIVRGVQQGRQLAAGLMREMDLIKDDEAAQTLADTMKVLGNKEYRAPRETEEVAQEFNKAEGFAEAAGVVLRNPIRVLETLTESVIASSPMIPATIASGMAGSAAGGAIGAIGGPVGATVGAFVGGRAGMAGAAFAGNLAMEYSSAIVDAVTQAGGDPTDARQIEAAFKNPEIMAAAREKGVKRGMAVGTFEAIGAMVAGRFAIAAHVAAKEAAKAGVKAGIKGSMTVAALKEAGTQAAASASGEVAAQRTEGRYAPGEVLGEVLVGGLTDAAEVGTAMYNDRQASKAPVKPGIMAGSTPGTQGSVGAAGADKAEERRLRAANLPVPVPMSKGAASKDAVQQQFEKQQIQDAETGAELRKLSTESTEAILQNFDAIEEQTGRNIAGIGSDPEASTEAVGKSVVDPILEQVAIKKAEIKKAFDDADEAGETAEPVSYAKLSQYLSEQTPTEKEQISPILKLAEEQLAKNDPEGTGSVSLKATRDIRQAIGAAMQPGTPGYVKGIELKALIDESTRDAGGDLYKKARQLHQKYAAEFKDQSIIRDLIKLKPNTSDRKIAFEKVFRNTVMTGSVEDLRRLEKTLMGAGEKGAQAMRELRGEAVRYIRTEATRTQTKDDKGNKVPSVAGLSKAVEGLDKDGKLEMLFGKKGAEVFRDMAEAASDIYALPSQLVNTSGTANAIKKIGQAMIEMATNHFLSGGIIPVPVATTMLWLNRWRQEAKVKKQVAEAVKQPRPELLLRKPDLTARPFERSAAPAPTPAAPGPAKAPSAPAKAAPVPAGKATELDDRQARRLLPTKRERELMRLMDEATDPEIKKDLQRQVDADRKERDNRARGEEYLQLADSTTDPALRATLEAKAKKLGVERKVPAGDATEVETIEATSLADVEANWQKTEKLNAENAQRAKDVLEAFLIDPAATTKATTQFASQPTSYDRAIRKIIEGGKNREASVETIVQGSDAAQGSEGSVRQEDGQQGDQQGELKFSERQPAQRSPEADEQAKRRVIDLRKDLNVLSKLKGCIA